MASVLLALSVPALAQLDLGTMNLRTVRVADAGTVALPRFDSVALDVQVEAGVARTRATLVWTATAGARPLYNWRCRAPEPETTFVTENSWLDYSYGSRFYHDTLRTYWEYNWSSEGTRVDSTLQVYATRVTTCRVDSLSYRQSKLDSLELSASFQLPTDVAVTDLDLWVGDQKQSAWIMDRWQASAQYNSIVGIRQDPALLETWGGGSYSLRVFPQTTGQTRRLEIEFVQAWRPGMALPVAYTRAPSQQSWIWNDTGYTVWERTGRTPGVVSVSLSSKDGAPVGLDLGGLGNLTAGATAVSRVFEAPATFSGKVPASTGSVWTAVRDGRPAFGAHLNLRGTEFAVETPPRDRIVILDATQNLERARRLALLALLQYGTTDDHRVDLAWRDVDGSLKRLWGSPREFTSEAALEAVAALKAWTPAKAADPLTSLREVLASDSGRVLIFLSDAETPAFSEPAPAYPTTSDSDVWEAYQRASTDWNQRYQAFYKSRGDAWTALGDSLDRRNQKLFGWWRDWNIGTASEATGGYAFGDLQWGSWSWWRTGDSLLVPELFGGSRRGWSEGFQHLKLKHSGLAVDSLAHDLTTNNRTYWWGRPIFIRPRPIVLLARSAPSATLLAARSAAASLPESLVVTLAGRQANAGTLNVGVEGHWGGLKVKATRSLQVPVNGGQAGASLWAYQYSRSLQPWIWSFDTVTNAVRNLGRAYRVATTATSFLALEPGMVPFDSIGGQGEELKAGDTRAMSMVSFASTADTAVNATGSILLDSLSLESLLAGRVLAVSPRGGVSRKALRLSASNGLVIQADASAEIPKVRILDLQGRQLAVPAMTSSGEGWVAQWRPSRTTFVIVQMVQSGNILSERILVRP
jgi:hypothetical protein